MITTPDALEIDAFLARPAGQALLSELFGRRPSMKGANFEERSINSGIAEGWEECIKEIVTISKERPGAVDLGQDRLINPSVSDDMDPSKRPTHKL